ncbi:hypothetical protein [Fictibacillus barbaricus]|uniref:Membrane protein n=1 Tax=Fictibacillus barbaricus TaxID=182136 RepID=A0ABU1TW85_9BACL|nr:hypothetical protein [Fictibacillus barbaricus]MDR7071478.1 putative membrane protein [Fictibacillus barbaricus]
MSKKVLRIMVQSIGIIGFFLAVLNYQTGWMIGFFCSGLLFLFLLDREKKAFDYGAGSLSLLYSFYIMLVTFYSA